MPNGADRAIYEYQGFDCWRTWFIEECEQSKLFGVTVGYLGRVECYRVGTRIFLEDAPWYSLGGQTHHRICGPYEVVAIDKDLPQDAQPKYRDEDNKIIVFKAAHPEDGPWRDGIRPRNINNNDVNVIQTASRFSYYPYRFAIRHAHDFEDKCIEHRRI